ncbi:hypothetical protein ACI65C_002862 [Semiaphis heraclei]
MGKTGRRRSSCQDGLDLPIGRQLTRTLLFYNRLLEHKTIRVLTLLLRSEERQYCWNCNSRISPRCGRRLSRHLARSVSVPPTRNIHKSVPCIIRSKSMPYREKDTGKMPTNFENSSIKTCFSLSSLHPSTVNVEDGQQAAQRPYNSLTKKLKKNETTNQDCWRGDSSYEFLSSLRTSYQYLMDNNLIESCREVGCDLNNASPIQDWNVERLNIYIKELEKSFCSGSASKSNSCNLTENLLSPKRLSMSEEVRRLNILRHIAQLSKRLPHCREPSLNQSCSSIYNAQYLEVKSNLRSLDQWMAQMEVRLKPNYFRVNWNRREIRQKAEEHKTIANNGYDLTVIITVQTSIRLLGPYFLFALFG